MKTDIFALGLAFLMGVCLMIGTVGFPSNYVVTGSDIRNAVETCEQLGKPVATVTGRSSLLYVQCEGGPMVTLTKEK